MTVSKFEVGDKVYAPYRGYGIVTKIHDDNCVYPIEVTWNNRWDENIGNVSTFTENGGLFKGSNSPIYTITVVGHTLPEEETEEAADSKFKVGDRVWLNANERGTIVRFCTNEETCIVNSDIEGEVEMRTDALEKIEDSAINPAHYQVEGIPEAIDIMTHLMTKEQFEGFLWGNIIKYSYRYGRKGDKAETAGKIAWYANQMKALEERGDGE
jgi:hypothetical protein